MMTNALGVVDGAAQPPGMTCSHRTTLATSCMSVLPSEANRGGRQSDRRSPTGQPPLTAAANRTSPESCSVLGPWYQASSRTTKDRHGHHPGSSRAVLRARQTGVMSLTTTRSIQLPRRTAACPRSSCHRGRASPQRSRWSPTAQPDTGVILGGRATSVPVTAVLTGPQRTTTDNAAAGLTCGILSRPR